MWQNTGMARPVRADIKGGHVPARGIEGRAISEEVRELEFLEDMVGRYGVQLYAFCRMMNSHGDE